MPRESWLSIANVTIEVRCEDDRLRWMWQEPVSRFLVSERPADVELTVRLDDSSPAPLDVSSPAFDSGAVWRLYREPDGHRLDFHSEAFGDAPYKMARFDENFTRGEIVMQPHVANLNPLDYPLDEVLMANLLGRGRGVELHSCGIIDRTGRGHLFVGVSGAGKSTTARLWEGSANGVVSDDRVIVREHGEGMWMFGTPWHGEAELSMPGGAPLAGIYLLVQSQSNELLPLERADAIARLFRCTFPLFFDSSAIDFTLSFLERLASTVPVRELRFTRDRSVVDLVLAA